MENRKGMDTNRRKVLSGSRCKCLGISVARPKRSDYF